MSSQRLSVEDAISFANTDFFVTKHLRLDWTIDFPKKQISGSVTLDLSPTPKCLATRTNEITLDSKDLDIKKVVCNFQEVPFHLSEKVHEFGSKLSIDISTIPINDASLAVEITYSTSSSASALQWLDANQTSGKKLPFVFSQCEAIHARSILPCQDTPGVKATYNARVEAEYAYEVVFAAVKQNTHVRSDSVVRLHDFEQTVPVPSYLIAFACGALVSKEIGPRSKVWSEAEVVEEAAWEFAEVEQILQLAEGVCGPYLWHIYDILVLPPSFPYGGMENPCLTFVTPSLLAGDRSLVNVIAHEIAHSWTGNLVTNKTWDDFWLNEGHTRFLDQILHAKLEARTSNGDKQVEALHRELDLSTSRRDLKRAVGTFADTPLYTVLVPDLTGVDPDDCFSCVPYEKGSNFLFYIESLVGSDLMLQWLRAYLEKFKYQSITTDTWKSFLIQFFEGKTGTVDLSTAVDWNAWLKAPGYLPVEIPLQGTLASDCQLLANYWGQPGPEVKSSVESKGGSSAIFTGFSTQQKIIFLDMLLECPVLSHTVLQEMEQLLGMFSIKNAEIFFRWLQLCLKAKYNKCLEPTYHFLSYMGRMKYVAPLYKSLSDWEEERQKTIEFFRKTRPSMHIVTAKKVANTLKLD